LFLGVVPIHLEIGAFHMGAILKDVCFITSRRRADNLTLQLASTLFNILSFS